MRMKVKIIASDYRSEAISMKEIALALGL